MRVYVGAPRARSIVCVRVYTRVWSTTMVAVSTKSGGGGDGGDDGGGGSGGRRVYNLR